jgi:hypothetical protein
MDRIWIMQEIEAYDSLPTHVDGYPVVYLTIAGDELCATCALANDDNWPDEPLSGAIVYYEGAPIDCADCGRVILSAYGDPDEIDEIPFEIVPPEPDESWDALYEEEW